GAVVGFKRTHDGLLDRVAALEAQRPSTAGPSGAPEILTQLGEVEDTARKLQADQEEAERKAREDDEREKQRAAWQGRVNAAKDELPRQRIELANAESERGALEDALRSIAESLKSADGKVKKDLKADRGKRTDELQRARKAADRLRGEIEALEKQAGASFEFRPPPEPKGRPAQPGARFVPPVFGARAAATVPHEALPEEGSLRSHQGQRYLVIERWDQLATGEQAASRLSAKLVAPEKT
ncbi:MAG: hypothetical protein VKS61_10325, partial [Candidatus Sericytochromatia bacterium]|nr:hypothetical protein [Candidatus Sericytochromatia bacterium]